MSFASPGLPSARRARRVRIAPGPTAPQASAKTRPFGAPRTWLIVIYKLHKGQCLPQVLPPGVKAYPDQPKLTDSAQAGTLVGSREQTIAFMADSPGHYAIPALTVIWRDTRTNQPRTATLAAQMLTVLPPPGIAPSAMPAPQARAPQSARPSAAIAKSWWSSPTPQPEEFSRQLRAAHRRSGRNHIIEALTHDEFWPFRLSLDRVLP